ncbi:MAG: hypothetical protein KGP29_00535 [Proteobacteria bacterium]|nr:hypothetical protein [Pseudomonadota bacterium]
MKDQEHHHTRQENSPREYSSDRPRQTRPDSRNSFKPRKNSSKLIGQIFGLIYNLVLLYLVYDLAKSGSEKLALGIFAINAAFIFFVAVSVKKSFKHKPHNSSYRDGGNRSSRPSRSSQSSAR